MTQGDRDVRRYSESCLIVFGATVEAGTRSCVPVCVQAGKEVVDQRFRLFFYRMEWGGDT